MYNNRKWKYRFLSRNPGTAEQLCRAHTRIQQGYASLYINSQLPSSSTTATSIRSSFILIILCWVVVGVKFPWIPSNTTITTKAHLVDCLSRAFFIYLQPELRHRSKEWINAVSDTPSLHSWILSFKNRCIDWLTECDYIIHVWFQGVILSHAKALVCHSLALSVRVIGEVSLRPRGMSLGRAFSFNNKLTVLFWWTRRSPSSFFLVVFHVFYTLSNQMQACNSAWREILRFTVLVVEE